MIQTRSSSFRRITTPKIQKKVLSAKLTEKLEEYGACFFVEFVSGGPTTLDFSVFCPSTGKRATNCKVKGMTSNNENSKVVNFTTLRDMILENAPPVHVHNPQKIKRKNGGVVFQNPRRRSTSLFLRSAGLWTILTPSPMKHPFTLIVAVPSSCGKSTFVIRLLECMEQLCDIVFENIVRCHSENNAPHHLKNV